MKRYNVYLDGVIDRDVSPTNSDQLQFEWRQGDGWKYWRKYLGQQPRLYGQDYAQIYALLLANKCEQFQFRIYVDEVLKFTGLFTYYSITNINEDDCIIEFTTEPDDEYRCFLNHWKDKVNILDVANIVTARMDIAPNLEFETNTGYNIEFTYTVSSPTPPTSLSRPGPTPGASQLAPFYPAGLDWKIYDIQSTITDLDVVAGVGSLWNITYKLTCVFQFCRELLYVPPVGGIYTDPDTAVWHFRDFVNVGGITYKVFTRYVTFNTYDDDTPGSYTENIGGTDYTLNLTYTHSSLDLSETVDFERCRLLKDVINYMIALMGCTVTTHTSQFFYDLPNNPVTGQAQKLSKLLIGQKSDFKNPITSNPATRGILTMEEVLIILRETFGVYWHISGTKLVLEHETYYKAGLTYGAEIVGIDLTTLPNSTRYQSEISRYSIDFKKLFGRETFDWMEAEQADFIGADIIYSDACLPNKDSELRHDVQQVTTDIQYVWLSSASISSDGFVLLQTAYDAIEGVYDIESEYGQILTLFLLLNGHLSWSALHERYWKAGVRLLPSGTMNDNPATFGESLPLKTYVNITVPYCAIDSDPYELVKTSIGNGHVREMRYQIADGTLTVGLNYD